VTFQPRRAANRLARRVARAALWRLQQWLAETPSEGSAPRDYDREPFLYPWLNAKFREIANDPQVARKPQYIWGVLQGASLAKSLHIPRVSVIEFGVAGGGGLVALQTIAARVEALCKVAIDVYGFDTGHGLPKPQDWRDLPNLYAEGHFPMDPDALRAQLKTARLILGPVAETVPSFVASRPAPVAFVSIDLDLYTSTVHALKVFEAEGLLLLPRVLCYFDDILGFTFSEFTGERLAMSEFNAKHCLRKIAPIYGLKYFLDEAVRNQWWTESMYIAHLFDHELYGQHDGLSQLRRLDLRE